MKVVLTWKDGKTTAISQAKGCVLDRGQWIIEGRTSQSYLNATEVLRVDVYPDEEGG